MTQATAELPTIPGAERSLAERLAVQWPELDRNLFPEDRDCYNDPDRAAYIEASYAGIADAVEGVGRGEPVMLVGRRQERTGFERILALGELAGDGAGLFLDFRKGQIVIPTRRYALLARHSLTAVTKYEGPELRQGVLASGDVLSGEGLLQPKEDLMDRLLYDEVAAKPARSLRSIDKEEIWDRAGEIAIGEEDVAAMIERTLKTNGRTSRRIYAHDFSLLQDALTGRDAAAS